jgi:hypothetical protein
VFTHLAVTSELLFGIPLQMAKTTVAGEAALRERCVDSVDLTFDKSSSGIGMPGELIVMQTSDRKPQLLLPNACLQRRPQSIQAIANGAFIAVTYTNSGTLMFHEVRAGKSEFINTKALGLGNPRGVCEVFGSEVVAVTGNTGDVVLIDYVKKIAVAKIEANLGASAHAEFVSAS